MQEAGLRYSGGICTRTTPHSRGLDRKVGVYVPDCILQNKSDKERSCGEVNHVVAVTPY